MLLHFACARQHFHQLSQAAHLLHLPQLTGQVIEIKFAFLKLFNQLLSVLLLNVLACLLNQANDIAHAQDTTGNTIRVKRLNLIQLFAGTQQLDGCAGNSAHTERGATPAVTINPGQGNTTEANTLIKNLSRCDSVLTSHGIGDQQGFFWRHGVANAFDLNHQLIIDAQATCRVQNQDVKTTAAGFIQAALGDLDGGLTRNNRQCLNIGLLTQNSQLFLSRRAPRIQTGH